MSRQPSNTAPGQSRDPIPGQPRRSISRWLLAVFVATDLAGYLVASYCFAFWPFTSPPQTPPPVPPPAAIGSGQQRDVLTYNNGRYGFSVDLTSAWKGYAILNTKWEGRDTASNVADHGPIITLRHPRWTTAKPREDMPIMVFTLAQWQRARQEQMSLGAAPMPPSLLGQNSRFVLALPARYNYDYADGWEEVDRLVHTLKPHEPTCAANGDGKP